MFLALSRTRVWANSLAEFDVRILLARISLLQTPLHHALVSTPRTPQPLLELNRRRVCSRLCCPSAFSRTIQLVSFLVCSQAIAFSRDHAVAHPSRKATPGKAHKRCTPPRSRSPFGMDVQLTIPAACAASVRPFARLDGLAGRQWLGHLAFDAELCHRLLRHISASLSKVGSNIPKYSFRAHNRPVMSLVFVLQVQRRISLRYTSAVAL